MIYYLVLGFFTVIIIFLGWKIWEKSRNIAFVIGLFFVYYWTLLGSWFLIYDQITGKGTEIGLHYHYLFDKMFTVNLDNNYLISIIYYSIFIITLQSTIYFFLHKQKVHKLPELPNRILVKLPHLMIICTLCLLASILIIQQDIIYGIQNNLSIYFVTRTSLNPYFTLHQILNQAAIVPLLIGLVVTLEPKKNKLILAYSSRFQFILFLIVLFLVEIYLVFLGNKSELLFAGIFCFLLYLMNRNYAYKWKHLIFLGLIIGIPLVITDTLRSYSLAALFGSEELSHKPEFDSDFSIKRILQSFLFSNELFSGHFSMYGVLNFDVPFTYGSSIISFLASVFPKILWPDRPSTIYEYYAASVNATPGQGYTINHATGWYLNFGIPGIFIGAVLLGYIWVYFYKLLHSDKLRVLKNKFFILVVILTFPSLTAQIAKLIRTGPEGYKGIIIDGIILPVIILYIVSEVYFNRNLKLSEDAGKN